MTTTPKSSFQFYLTLDQVRESGLLSPTRMAEVEAEIEKRISIPLTADGRPIETARYADLRPYTSYLYPRMDHDPNWMYIRREVMAVVLTEEERELLDRHALNAASKARDAQRYTKATKVKDTEWAGEVIDGDNYYDSVDDMYQAWEDRVSDGEADYNDFPPYVWATRKQPVIGDLDVSGVIESDVDARGWEDMDTGDFHGVAELQVALDAFVKANESVVSSEIDYSTAVVVGPEAIDRLAAIQCNRDGIDPVHQR